MIKQILLLLIFAVWLWEGEKTAVAYKEETTHKTLTLQTLRLLDPEAYQEIHRYRDRLLTGVQAEDQFPRFNLHFYDPLTGLGLPRNSYTDFVEKGAFGGRLLLGELQPTNIRAPKGPGLRYMNALEWGRSEMPDDLDWEGAIWAYDYTESARERAYEAVGHVLHLLQDMGQPDHVQNRSHPGNDPRVHQFFASINRVELNRVGYERLWSLWSGQWPRGKQPERLTSLEEAFRKLAEESKQAEYDLGLPLKGEMALGLGPWPWALGGKPQFFPGSTTLDLLDVAVKRRLFRDNLWAKYELFIPLVPTIPLIPTNEAEWAHLDKYKQLGERLLPRVEEYGAGLLMLFHAIVNPPPFVESVQIWQKDELRYEKRWDPGVEIDRLMGRDLKPKAEKALVAGVPAEVRLWFGPKGSAGDASGRIVQERVVVKRVSVEYKGEQGPRVPLLGMRRDSEGGLYWYGTFTPERSGTLVIEAHDRDTHLNGRHPFGDALDSDPATPARALVKKNRNTEGAASQLEYGWENYEPGPDRHHHFTVEACLSPEQAKAFQAETWSGTVEEQREEESFHVERPSERATLVSKETFKVSFPAKYSGRFVHFGQSTHSPAQLRGIVQGEYHATRQGTVFTGFSPSYKLETVSKQVSGPVVSLGGWLDLYTGSYNFSLGAERKDTVFSNSQYSQYSEGNICQEGLLRTAYGVTFDVMEGNIGQDGSIRGLVVKVWPTDDAFKTSFWSMIASGTTRYSVSWHLTPSPRTPVP